MAGNNQDPTSTLQSTMDKVTGAAQSVVGSITGNTVDQKQADDKKLTADAEKELSHSAVKAGPFTAHPSGGVAKDDPNRSAGAWNQTVGAAKESIGGLVGAEGLRQEGIQQNKEGKGQEAEGQLTDLGKGISDRVGGTIGGVVGGLTGNKEAQDAAKRQHDDGKARQRGVEVDLQKQNPQ